MLRTAFEMAALTFVHTGAAALVAYANDHASPMLTAAHSFGGGMLGIIFGSFAGHCIHDSPDPHKRQTSATILGLTGYALGSTAGFLIR